MGLVAALFVISTFNYFRVWSSSINLWEAVVQKYPNRSQLAHSNLATSYQMSGRLMEALKEYDRAIVIPPPSPSAHNGKGTTLFDLGYQEKGIEELKKALVIDPNYLNARKNLAAAYKKMGKNEEYEKELSIIREQMKN